MDSPSPKDVERLLPIFTAVIIGGRKGGKRKERGKEKDYLLRQYKSKGGGSRPI